MAEISTPGSAARWHRGPRSLMMMMRIFSLSSELRAVCLSLLKPFLDGFENAPPRQQVEPEVPAHHQYAQVIEAKNTFVRDNFQSVGDPIPQPQTMKAAYVP